MLAIFEKIRKPAADAADLRQRHAEVAETLPQLEAEVRRHQQRRADGLLSLADREVERIEQELALAVRNRDRGRAALEELERRAGAAEEAETLGRVEALRDAAEARASGFADEFAKRFDKAAEPLRKLLAEHADIDAQIAATNAEALRVFVDRGAPASAPAPILMLDDRLDARPGWTAAMAPLLGPIG